MKSYFQQLNTLFFAFLAAQLLLCIVALFLVLSENALVPNAQSIFLWIGALVLMGLTALGFRFYRNSEKNIPQLLNVEQKMEHYRRYSLIRWASIESANLLMIVMLLLEHNFYVLCLFGIGILFFWYTRPNKEVFEKRYGMVIYEHEV
jgi:hypothetical protein